MREIQALRCVVGEIQARNERRVAQERHGDARQEQPLCP
jgi:hypothetical protein